MYYVTIIEIFYNTIFGIYYVSMNNKQNINARVFSTYSYFVLSTTEEVALNVITLEQYQTDNIN
jgi:hypothetical protein